ncbi:MAG TPA: zinc ABC transporter ATP-binding protein, partial [Clostridiales bacterium]|nr:zinc ABC transporter ATP-binding protein [Clostridiales bacterium]
MSGDIEKSSGNKAVSIKDLSVDYGRISALSGVCLDVMEGEYLGIIGPNGGGKSTLLKAVLGLLKPFGGSVTLNGVKGVGYVPQLSYAHRKFPITVLEV